VKEIRRIISLYSHPWVSVEYDGRTRTTRIVTPSYREILGAADRIIEGLLLEGYKIVPCEERNNADTDRKT
jgi:hypothetical protein